MLKIASFLLEIEKFYKTFWERDEKKEFQPKLTVTDVHEHGDMISVRGTACIKIKDKTMSGK